MMNPSSRPSSSFLISLKSGLITAPLALLGVMLLGGVACGGPAEAPDSAAGSEAAKDSPTVAAAPTLEIVAESPKQWTGVAVAAEESGGERIFVNYPRWSDDVPVSVAELVAGEDGMLRPVPYPDEAWNGWSPEGDVAGSFVCVQALYADERGSLWILDPASPGFAGVVPGGAKLVQVDLASNEVSRVYSFSPDAAPANSYLNDLRIDHGTGTAYISESGAGSLVVLDLESGDARRVLADHPSTSSEGIRLTIGGSEWLMGGEAMDVHADGIALSPDGESVYYQALTGRTLYRVPAASLRAALGDEAAAAGLAEQVETVVEVGASDGIIFGPGGIYLSSLELDAVRVWNPEDPEAGVTTVVQDERLAWPDSFARGAGGGTLYVTTAQIHRGAEPPEPYRLWRIAGLAAP
ncbi:MAG: L-dopachrome tautomerase-related protein [Acidobacteriota bacterium]